MRAQPYQLRREDWNEVFEFTCSFVTLGSGSGDDSGNNNNNNRGLGRSRGRAEGGGRGRGMERVRRVGIGYLKGRPEGGSVLAPVVGREIFGKGGSVL